MCEDSPKKDNHQGLIGYFKNRVEKLLFGLLLTLILLYLFAYYLAVKSLIFLKGLSELRILPLLLFLVVFSGLISQKISIILTVLIYCILTYQISPKLMKPLFGDFGGLWWIRIIVLALACVYSYFLWGVAMSGSDYVGFALIAFLMISSIPFGKMILDKSDMVQWKGPLPTLYSFLGAADEVKKEKEEQIREYKGVSDDSMVKRKITRGVPVYASGMVFSAVCILLGLLFLAFHWSGILLGILISVWLMKDLHYLMRKKSLFKFESVKKVFVRQPNPEEWIISSILSFKRQVFVKQVGGFMCIFFGHFWSYSH